jgi:tetratricopeptide (TPR) repeat protein
VQSTELLDRRMQCLEERRAELAGLVAFVVHGEPASVAAGSRLVRDLVPVDRCADLAALGTRIEPPANLAQSAEAHVLRLAMAQGHAAQVAGHYREALPQARAVLASARTLDYGPVIGEAALALGTLQTQLGAYADARATLQEAARVATSVFDNRTAAEAWTSLANVEGVGLRDLAAGDQALTWAESLLGPSPPQLPLARMLEIRSKLAVLHGRPRDAEAMLRRVLAIREDAYGKDDRMVAETLDQLGVAISEQDRAADAQPFHERAAAIRDRTLGPGHPERATALELLGLLASDRGKHDEAIELLRQAVAIRRAGLGDAHPLVGTSLNHLGLALRRAKRDTEAMTTLREALAIRERALGPDHLDVATTLMNIANVLGSTNRCAEALPMHERVAAILERAYGPDHPRTADELANVASALECVGRPRDAIAPYRRAIATYEARGGPSSTNVARVLSSLGQALIDAKQPGEAAVALERAVTLVEHAPHVDPEQRVAAHFRLGVALWDDAVARHSPDRRVRERARTLVDDALHELITLRTADPSDIRDLQAWLANHRT